MRNLSRFLGPILFVAAMLAKDSLAPVLADDPLESTSAEPILPDPLPYKGTAFPASAATAGTADPGPALGSLRVDDRNCSALNPCGVPSPALMTSASVVISSDTVRPKETRAGKAAPPSAQGAEQR